MSRRVGPPIPEPYRSGPVAPGRVSRGPLEYRLYPKTPTSPWVEEIPKQGENPKKTGRIRLWISRNPTKTHHIGVALGLLIFFSRPLYDAFLRERIEGPLSPRPPNDKRGCC